MRNKEFDQITVEESFVNWQETDDEVTVILEETKRAPEVGLKWIRTTFLLLFYFFYFSFYVSLYEILVHIEL